MTTPTAAGKPCACGSYSYLVPLHEDAGGDQVWERRTTECTSTTQSTYAQGHDAKLRKFLVSAGVAGHRVHRAEGNIVIVKDPARVAADLGWESDVRAAIDRGKRAS
ncbi:hypothetical protein ACFVZA_01175 [Streptomyces bottropensis]|uniref:hypothetical protein n=1 Tax=Streptomyces bottropensis TaxID=42235 RepID=UPI0036C782E0